LDQIVAVQYFEKKSNKMRTAVEVLLWQIIHIKMEQINPIFGLLYLKIKLLFVLIHLLHSRANYTFSFEINSEVLGLVME